MSARLDSPTYRRRIRAADAAVLLCVVLFAVLGLVTHHSVVKLASLGAGVVGAGTSVQQGFNSAAQAVSAAPVIGEQLAAGLTKAGAQTGGRVTAFGLQGESDARGLATLLGWLTFLIPTALLLIGFLPHRVRQAPRRCE